MRRVVATAAIVTAALLVPFAAPPAQGAQFTHPTGGYTLTYPDRWNCDTGGLSVGASGPVFTTFPRKDYGHGGIIPDGGARIFVNAYPENTAVRLFEKAQSEWGTDIKESRQRDGMVRVDFTETWEAGTFKKVWIARPRGGKVFEFMLEYYADDPKGTSYERDLDAIVASLSVSVVTSSPSVSTPNARQP